MKNRVLHPGLKSMLYEARVGLSTTPIPREVFDSVEHEQQFGNGSIAATASSEYDDDDAISVKESPTMKLQNCDIVF